MQQVVICKKRRNLAGGPHSFKEVDLLCRNETDLLNALRGYRSKAGNCEIDPKLILSHFDPCRPTMTVTLDGADGLIETITRHTLH